MKRAIFPGSFDPLTKGHLDIIERASHLFDELIIVILENSDKRSFFQIEERLSMIRKTINHLTNVRVDAATSLTIDYARRVEACAIVRGVRSIKDYEYELEIAQVNRYLEPSIETLFLFASAQHAYVSSSMIREMVKYHADVKELVSEEVYQKLMSKVSD